MTSRVNPSSRTATIVNDRFPLSRVSQFFVSAPTVGISFRRITLPWHTSTSWVSRSRVGVS